MSRITVIGIGGMGSAIAGIAAAGGAEVQLVARDEDKARGVAARMHAQVAAYGEPLTGDIVVLAVPVAALDDIVATYGTALAGKVLVDITNPINFDTFDDLTVPPNSSAAANLAAMAPGARVVKAFNTNFAATLGSTIIGTERTTVLVAGDDEDAKAAVRAFAEAGGLQTRDAGSLKRARELEAMAFLQITLAKRQQIPWTGGFAVIGLGSFG